MTKPPTKRKQRSICEPATWQQLPLPAVYLPTGSGAPIPFIIIPVPVTDPILPSQEEPK